MAIIHLELSYPRRHRRGHKQMDIPRFAACLLLGLGIIGILILGCFTFGALSQGYAWSEMDWNEDGRTTIEEFLRSADIGKRQIQIDSARCSEFYALKDGLPVKTVCPQVLGQ